MPEPTRRLAVLGHPIEHSRSPALHTAAYQLLGLDWSYSAVELEAAQLADFVTGLDKSWRGLSLTMPHKHVVLPLLDERDSLVDVVGAANTILFEEGRRRGFNTDVEGIVRAFADHGVTSLDSVQLLGAGATAQSALAAAASLGAQRALVSVRDPSRAVEVERLAERLGLQLTVRAFGMQDRSLIAPDAIISTLPGGVLPDQVFPEAVRESSVLFDVAYDPWPSALATLWGEVGGTVVSGLEMLLHQAVAQVRIFVSGQAAEPLEREAELVAVMRRSVGL